MFTNFKDSNYQEYLGAVEPEASNLGYRFITENKEKIDNLGVRIVGKEFTIERKVPRMMLLSSFWD